MTMMDAKNREFIMIVFMKNPLVNSFGEPGNIRSETLSISFRKRLPLIPCVVCTVSSKVNDAIETFEEHKINTFWREHTVQCELEYYHFFLLSLAIIKFNIHFIQFSFFDHKFSS